MSKQGETGSQSARRDLPSAWKEGTAAEGATQPTLCIRRVGQQVRSVYSSTGGQSRHKAGLMDWWRCGGVLFADGAEVARRLAGDQFPVSNGLVSVA